MIIIRHGEIKAQKDVLNSTSQVLTLKLNVRSSPQTSVLFISASVLLDEWMSECTRASERATWEPGARNSHTIAWSLGSGSDVETDSEPWLRFIESSDQGLIYIFSFYFVPFSCS